MSDIGKATQDLQENVDRADVWVNGGVGAHYESKDGSRVPSIQTLTAKGEVNISEAKKSEENALKSAIRAEEAAYLSQKNSNIYDSVEEGLADTSVGDIFQVADSNYNYIYKKGEDGREILITKSPNMGYFDYFEKDVQEKIDAVDKTSYDDDDKSILKVVDTIGNIVAYIDIEGGLFLPHLDNMSIQETISNKITSDNIFTLQDVIGNIVAYVSKEGELFLPLLKNGVSVQKSLIELEKRVGNDQIFQGAKFYDFSNDYGSRNNILNLFSDDVMKWLSINKSSFPPAYGIYESPLRENTGEWLGKVNVDSKHIEVITPYNPRNRVVHPYILEFTNSWRGYRYILGLTGYYNTNENEENPFLMASNDLENWDLISDVLAERPDVESGHNSDIFLAHDPKNGHLLVCWRQSIRGVVADDGSTYTEDSVWYKTTSDGVNFSEAKLMTGRYKRTEDINLSPTIIYDDKSDTWNMYNVGTVRNEAGSNVYGIWHRQSKYLDGEWVVLSKQVINSQIIKPWHMEVKWVGDRLVALVQDNTKDKKQLYFGIADKGDLNGFIFSDNPVLNDTSDGVYKASFSPVFEDEKVGFIVAWTGDHSVGIPDEKWKLFINKTNFEKL